MRYNAEALEDVTLYSIGDSQLKIIEKVVPTFHTAIVKTIETLVIYLIVVEHVKFTRLSRSKRETNQFNL